MIDRKINYNLLLEAKGGSIGIRKILKSLILLSMRLFINRSIPDASKKHLYSDVKKFNSRNRLHLLTEAEGEILFKKHYTIQDTSIKITEQKFYSISLDIMKDVFAESVDAKYIHLKSTKKVIRKLVNRFIIYCKTNRALHKQDGFLEKEYSLAERKAFSKIYSQACNTNKGLFLDIITFWRGDISSNGNDDNIFTMVKLFDEKYHPVGEGVEDVPELIGDDYWQFIQMYTKCSISRETIDKWEKIILDTLAVSDDRGKTKTHIDTFFQGYPSYDEEDDPVHILYSFSRIARKYLGGRYSFERIVRAHNEYKKLLNRYGVNLSEKRISKNLLLDVYQHYDTDELYILDVIWQKVKKLYSEDEIALRKRNISGVIKRYFLGSKHTYKQKYDNRSFSKLSKEGRKRAEKSKNKFIQYEKEKSEKIKRLLNGNLSLSFMQRKKMFDHD